MGLLKFVAKAAGTVVVGGIGCATTMLKACCEATGKDEGAELLDSAKSACFGCVRNMWSDNSNSNDNEYSDEPRETFEDHFENSMRRKANEIKKEMDKNK